MRLSAVCILRQPVIYVFREAYIVIIIEQFWSFVNSVLTTEQAKRINGPFCAVASMGSFVGGMLVSRWAVALGSEALLLFTAASLVPTAVFGVIAYKLGGEPKPSEEEAGGRLGHLGVKTPLPFQIPAFYRRINLKHAGSLHCA